VASRLLISQQDSRDFRYGCRSPDKGEQSAETTESQDSEHLIMANDKMKRPEGVAEFHEETKNQSHFQRASYARELRAVGQALEARHVVSLDLELKGGLYLVRGKVTASDYAKASLSAFVQDFISGVGCVFTGASRRSLYEIDLSYNPQDVEKLDLQGREHRRNTGQNPDPYALAQKLRGIGSFLDYRPETTLTGISVEDRWVTVRYKTAEGRIEQAKQDVSYFYNYWTKMYLRRSQRQNPAFPGEKAVMVDWEMTEKRESNSTS
jgi:hypothetical protein